MTARPAEPVDLPVEQLVLLQAVAQLDQRVAKLARQRGVGITGGPEQRFPALFPDTIQPRGDGRILDHLELPLVHLLAEIRIMLQFRRRVARGSLPSWRGPDDRGSAAMSASSL